VFAQAQDRRVPALERLRFLCILSSNLDEFFEIRVAELKERIRLGNEIEIPGETPSAEVFPLVSERTHTLVAEQYRLLNKEIFPELADEGVRFLAEQHWTREQRSWLHNYFLREMIPLLTPSVSIPRTLSRACSTKEPEFHRATRRSRCVRAQLRNGDRAGAAGIAASDPAAEASPAGARSSCS